MEQSDEFRKYLENKLEQFKKQDTIARRKRILMQVVSIALVVGVIVGPIPAATLTASIITIALLASMIAGDLSA